MKKAFLFAVIIIFIGMANTARAGIYLYDDDGIVYRLWYQVGYPSGYYCFISTAENGSDHAEALVFWNPAFNALKVCVIGNAVWDSWTYEGYWQGNGTYIKGIRNDSGYVYQIDTVLFIADTASIEPIDLTDINARIEP